MSAQGSSGLLWAAPGISVQLYEPNLVRNDTATDHFDHPGGPGSELVRNGTETTHIDHQDDLEPNLVRNDIVTEPLYFLEGFRSGPFVSPGSFWSTRGVPRCEELALFY